MRRVSVSLFYSLTASCILLMSSFAQEAADVREAELVRSSVVKIECTHERPNYVSPWASGSQGGGVGTGFIIDGKRILTNAHVVSDARYLDVKREGVTKKFKAKIKYIAHDCDLAILEIEESVDEFFKGTTALQIGGVPKLNSKVAAYGYPIGGQRMSVTRGIVSRIEFNTYSHSGLDQHLTIQVDAAINPGNSGGPVVQAGKVIGVAFQSYRGNVAQSTGYMIPTPVISRMIKDCEDGSYDGYTELAVFHTNLENAAFRRYLGLNGKSGVYVNEVMKQGSADGSLKPGDVLLKIDGQVIDNTGNIKLDGEDVQLEEVVERKFHGDKVRFEVFRDGKTIQADVTLKDAAPFKIFSTTYDKKPRFVLFAGLNFQPATRNVMAANKISNPNITYLYNFFIRDSVYLTRPELIVLTSIIPDPLNTEFKGFTHSLVDEINGVKIRRLTDVSKAFKKDVKHHVIRLYQQGRPIVIDAAKVGAAAKRIKRRYQIHTHERLGE